MHRHSLGAFFASVRAIRESPLRVGEDATLRVDDIQGEALMIYHPGGMDDIPPAADDIQRVALI